MPEGKNRQLHSSLCKRHDFARSRRRKQHVNRRPLYYIGITQATMSAGESLLNRDAPSKISKQKTIKIKIRFYKVYILLQKAIL